MVRRSCVPNPKADTQSTSWGALNPYKASSGMEPFVAAWIMQMLPTFWENAFVYSYPIPHGGCCMSGADGSCALAKCIDDI